MSLPAQPITREAAQSLDAADALAPLRARFGIDDAGLYMDGNSLGRPPLAAQARVSSAMAMWQRDLILAWREWIHLPRQLGDLLATSVLGAQPGEVIVADSTSVNLHKAAAAALAARPGRRKIITADDNFPTDLYVLQSLAKQHGHTLQVLAADGLLGLDAMQLARAVDGDTALVALSHVAYRSGALLDIAQVTRVIHDAGSLVLWDLSHSAGAVPVRLQDSGADLAVGCSYKYLNGGPGAPAYVYVRAERQRELRQPLWGWFGHARQFEMAPEFEPAQGIESWLVGIPPILSMVAMAPGLELVAEAGIERLHAKGRLLTEFVIALADEWLAQHGFALATPRNADRRGAHVTLRHPLAKEFVRALIREGVTPDFRPPDMIRFGTAPMYTRFVDVWDALATLRRLCTARPELAAAPVSDIKADRSG